MKSIPITLQALRKTFGSTVAVEHVDLAIEPGDLFFLLGPSGCGKTTLLRMLAGFTEPTSGTIRFGDDDVTNLPANKRNTGMVFQGYALWPHMTVAQNVAFGLDVRKVPADEKARRVEAALKHVQLHQYAERKPNQLSGGQQQRVALARALVIEPSVLLLDEPLSNLDAKLRGEMRSSIRQICKQAGITAVYVTHDQKEALSMADQIAVMQGGKVLQVGPPRELYQKPRQRFVADFLGETNFLTAEVVKRNGSTVQLDSPAGVLESSVFPDDLPDQGGVTVSIRPEALRLRPGQTEPAPNRFSAKRQSVTYLGEMAQHELTLDGQVTLRAYELNAALLDPTDEQFSLEVEPADVVVLRD